MRPAIDLRGQQFGRLTVLERAPPEGRNARWRVRCECGDERTVRSFSLRSGETRSCGCLQAELVAERSTTHGLHGTPEYHALWSARRRCTNPAAPDYARYGGRGIGYRFPADYGDATALLIETIGLRPAGLTLDRIDNDGHYEVGNLRWATRSQQEHNKRQQARDWETGQWL